MPWSEVLRERIVRCKGVQFVRIHLSHSRSVGSLSNGQESYVPSPALTQHSSSMTSVHTITQSDHVWDAAARTYGATIEGAEAPPRPLYRGGTPPGSVYRLLLLLATGSPGEDTPIRRRLLATRGRWRRFTSSVSVAIHIPVEPTSILARPGWAVPRHQPHERRTDRLAGCALGAQDHRRLPSQCDSHAAERPRRGKAIELIKG